MKTLLLATAAGLCLTGTEAELHRAFVGKQLILRIDMPGTHSGVDLHMDRDEPMDWKQYSQRIKNFGVSIPKGHASLVTSLVVKKDLIEVQLDGGGFGTFGDDTSTTVSTYVSKSSRERSLERDIRRETDPARRRRLQSSLSLERSERRREEARLRAAAEPANAIKRQEVMEKRLRGGSRFNLRNVARAGEATPEQVMDWLRDYVDFSGQVGARPMVQGGGPALRRGMTLQEAQQLLADGKLLSESVDAAGILTQQWEFIGDRQLYRVTSVEGLVVKYTVEPR